MDIYLVGGAVRDELLGLKIKERDWVIVGATPEDMIDLGYTPVGKDFTVFLHPKTKEEYALARTERKTAPGYTGFTFHAAPDVTLEEDLRRRDLTVNAIAKSTEGELIDPFNGAADIASRTLRHVSEAFVEDPVRILRIARFMARFAEYDFTIAETTNQLMRDMVENGEVDALIPERVWKEAVRGLGENRPLEFFNTLASCKALARVFPELGNIDSNTTAQAMQRAVSATDDVQIRFAILMYHLTELDGLESLYQRLRLPKDFFELGRLISKHFEAFTNVSTLNAEALFALLEQVDAFRREVRFEQFLQAADILANSDDDQIQSSHLRQAYQRTAAINAKSLVAQGLKGKEIGEALRKQRIVAVESLLNDDTS
ncbi:MAG: multifunctional CCA tRNA nucleotidyl transferase/2'3'-cyclic phosphodiesterase/2'nucleotidase/phosphatase [Pseudomonadota bacterium]